MGKFRKPARKRGIFKRKKQNNSKFMPRGLTKFGGVSTIDPPLGLDIPLVVNKIMKILSGPRS